MAPWPGRKRTAGDRLLTAAGGLAQWCGHGVGAVLRTVSVSVIGVCVGDRSLCSVVSAGQPAAGFGQFEGLRLLRGVGVLGAGVDLELAQHLAAEGVLRQHAAHGAAHQLGRLVLEQLGVARRAQAAGVPAVPVGLLVLGLARGHHHLVGVDDDHVVPGVDVRGKGGPVLAAQDGRNLRREPPEHEAVGVDDVPASLDVGDLGGKCAHETDLSQATWWADPGPGRAGSGPRPAASRSTRIGPRSKTGKPPGQRPLKGARTS